MDLMKHLTRTVLLVALVLFLISQMAGAGMIYDIEGIFAPSFVNDVAPSFVGEFEFPDDTVSRIEGWVELTNEPDVPRPIVLDMTLNLPGTMFQPWDTRLFSGMYESIEGPRPATMLWVDYDMEAGSSLDATLLEDGGGWDAMNLSFPDYPAGSLDIMTAQVNEPAGWALFIFGGVLLLGLIRSARRQ